MHAAKSKLFTSFSEPEDWDDHEIETGNVRHFPQPHPNSLVKFEVYGQEIVEKEVKQSGNSGRIYLPPSWVGRRVKIIRMD